MTPRLSVVMAVHNGMPFLERSVRSILDQTHGDFEFVIGDDGSTDGGSVLLAALAAADPRIRLLRRDSKSGLAASGNWVVGAATGDLVAICHADDCSFPDRLRRQVDALAADPGAVLVGTLSDGIDEGGRPVRPADLWRLTQNSPFAPFAHSSIMFRRQAFLAAGGYREAAEYWEDLDLYYRLGALGRLLVLPQVLTSVRHARTSTRLRERRDAVEDAVDLMYRSAECHSRGLPYEVEPGPAGRRLHVRTFVSRGSTLLWSGRRPGALGRLLRRGDLKADLATVQAFVWCLWAETSPRSLRLFIRLVLALRNRAASRHVERSGAVEWRPGAGTAKAAPEGRAGRRLRAANSL